MSIYIVWWLSGLPENGTPLPFLNQDIPQNKTTDSYIMSRLQGSHSCIHLVEKHV